MLIQIYSRMTWRGKRWYFRVKAKNGEVVAQSEGYHNQGDCWATANGMRRELFDAQIENLK